MTDIGLEAAFALDGPVALSSGTLVHVPVTIENTSDEGVELFRRHERLDIYLVRADGAPITMAGGGPMVPHEPVVVGARKSVTVDAAVALEPCPGTAVLPPPGEYGAAVCADVANMSPMVCSSPVPVVLTE